MRRRVATSARRFGRPLTGIVLLPLAMLFTSCGVPEESTARLVPESGIPDALDPSVTVPEISVERQRSISLWFVRGDELVNVRRTVPASTSQATVIQGLLAGPTDVERRDSVRSAIPDAAAIGQVTFNRGEADVSLSPEFAEIPAADQLLAVGQLVLTVTDMRGVGLVSFTINGEPASVPLPSGGSTSDPVSRDDYIDRSDEGL